MNEVACVSEVADEVVQFDALESVVDSAADLPPS